MGFEIASISKLVPSSHQNCSHLWQTEALIFVTSDQICHKICNCSQSSFVTIGHIIQNWSKLSLLITIFTIIKSRLSLVFKGKNCHKRYKLSKCSELSQLFKILTINIIVKLFKIVTIGYICQRKTGQHWFFHVWTSLNKCGQVWTSFDKFEQVWTSLDKFGQIWTTLDKFEQVWTKSN